MVSLQFFAELICEVKLLISVNLTLILGGTEGSVV